VADINGLKATAQFRRDVHTYAIEQRHLLTQRAASLVVHDGSG
jgi:hypothetical protein